MIRMILALILMILALIACGCQKKVAWSPAAMEETYSINAPQAVFPVQIDRQTPTQSPVGQPWYVSRNNDRLSHRAGAATASNTDYVIDIYDRQHQHNGKVYNHYHRTHRSQTYGSFTR
jgi:hypothetical protein